MLGGLEVVIDGCSVAVARAKVGALLAMLSLQPNTVVSADRLIDGLWGEDVPPGATATLHSYISILRRLVEPRDANGFRCIFSRKPGYSLAIDAGAVDALRFEALVAEGIAASRADDHRRTSNLLRSGLRLWRGSALLDLSFAAFAGAHIARLDELRLLAYETCIASELTLGRHHQLVSELDALVAANPLRETLRGQQMLGLYRSGRQADALRAFGDLRRTLGEELGIEPSIVLRQLESQILQQNAELDNEVVVRASPADVGSDAPRRPATLALPSGLTAPPWPTVGRTVERAWLHERADASGAGARLVELLVGAAGIGKSHLAGSFARERAANGTTVLFGRCSESPGLLYAPFTEALRSAIGELDGDQLRDLLGGQARDLSLLLPELGTRFPLNPGHPASTDGPSDSDVRRHLLFDAVALVLERLAADAPVVLVIDDLHWADESTINLIEHLIRRPKPSPLLVLATVRPVWAADDALGRAIHTLDRAGRSHATRLTGLSEHDVAALVRAQTELVPAQSFEAPAVRLLTARTDGNPFFVLEILRHLDGAAMSSERGVLPPRVLELIQQRLGVLAPSSRRILEIAAVIGKQFDIELCQSADPRRSDERAVLEALDEAVRADLIIEVPKAFGRYEFGQDLILDAILAGLTNTARRMAHRDVARAVEAQTSGGAARVSALARHWLAAGAAGDLAKAGHWAGEAARNAEKVAAWSEAARWYELALEALADAPIDDAATASRMRAELLVGRHTAIWCATDGSADPALVADAMDIGRALDDGALFADAVLASMLTTPRTETVRHIDLLEEALGRIANAGEVQDPKARRHLDVARVRVESVLTEALAFSARGDDAVAVARDALRGARALGDPELLANVVDQLIAELPPWATAERQSLITELTQVDRHNDPAFSMRIQHLDALVALERGEIARFIASTDAHAELTSRFGKQRSRAGAAQKRALGAFLEGRLGDASQSARDVLEISQHANFQQGQLCQIVIIDRERDALADFVALAASSIDDAAAAVRESGRLERQLSIAATAGLVMLDQGDTAGVRAAIDVCDGRLLGSSAKNFTYAFGLAALAELVAHAGTDHEVATLLPLVAACTGRHANMLGIVTLGSVDRVHAMLLARQGDASGAALAFWRAIDDHDRGGSAVLRARVRVDAASWMTRLADDRRPGDRGLDPKRLLAEAAPLIEHHGLTRLRRDAEVALDPAGSGTTSR